MERCLETTVATIALEPGNFRIDSKDWSKKVNVQGRHFLEHPDSDAWELLDGEFAGEQFFTQDAAFRHTLEAGKRIPTVEEWIAISLGVNPTLRIQYPQYAYRWRRDHKVRESLGLRAAGRFQILITAFCNAGRCGYVWTSSESWSSKIGYVVAFSMFEISHSSQNYRKNGASVRCLKVQAPVT